MPHRIFTDEEEDAIADFIQNNILTGLHFTDDDFMSIAHHVNDEKHLHNVEE